MGFLSPKVKINVDRGGLDEFFIQQSEYGRILPKPRGTVRLKGNVIWSTGIREEERTTTETQGGKGGAKTQTTTTERFYFQTFALKFAERECKAIRRIWLDKKIVFDVSGSSPQAEAAVVFRLMTGAETQLPDAAYEADKGVGEVSAWRGSTVVVFDDLPLENFGNRTPLVEVEIVFDDEGVSSPVSVTNGATLSGGAIGNAVLLDRRRRRIIAQENGFNGYAVWNMDTLQLMKEVPNSDLTSDEFDIDGIDSKHGYLLIVDHDASVFNQGVVLDPLSEAVIASRSTNDNFIQSLLGRVWNTTAAQGEVFFSGVAPNAVSGTVTGIRMISTSLLTTILQIDRDSSSYTVSTTLDSLNKTNVKFFPFTSSSEIQLYMMAVPGATAEYIFEQVATITPADFGGSAFSGVTSGIYDEQTNSIVFEVTLDGNPTLVRWQIASTSLGISQGLFYPENPSLAFDNCSVVWTREVPFFGAAMVASSKLYHAASGKVYAVAIGSGDIDSTFNGVNTLFSTSITGLQGDPTTFSYFGVNTSGTDRLVRVTLGSVGQGSVDIGDLVEEQCILAGLEMVEDFDTSGLAGTVKTGYLPNERESIGAAIEGLAAFIGFDVIESDGIIKFPLRGGASVASITEDELVPTDETKAEAYALRYIPSEELPLRVEADFSDEDNAYLAGNARAERLRNFTAVVETDNTERIGSRALVTNATDAAQRAEAKLYQRWLERDQLAARFSWEYLAIDPADVVTITLNSGFVGRFRVEVADIGADLSVDFRGLNEIEGQYISTTVSDGGTAIQDTVNYSGPTELLLLDIPLLRSADATDRSSSRLFYGAAAYGSSNWPGASVYQSRGDGSYNLKDQILQEAPWGITANALGDPPNSAYQTDNENVLQVAVVSKLDSWESKTELQVRNGHNYAAVKKANGEVELIQFQTVTVIDDNTIELSVLGRGRNGTENFTTGHAAGETIVLLALGTTRSMTLDPSTDLDTALIYRPVTDGQLFENALDVNFTSEMRDLMPWAPHDIQAVLDGSDIDFSWIRRTRYGGELKDSIDTVPLNEDSESYEIDIYDMEGGTFQRTLTSSTEAVTYDAADITSDFGSTPSSLYVEVYQMSAQVGRGFKGSATLEIS